VFVSTGAVLGEPTVISGVETSFCVWGAMFGCYGAFKIYELMVEVEQSRPKPEVVDVPDKTETKALVGHGG
jgi:hypothetical protein